MDRSLAGRAGVARLDRSLAAGVRRRRTAARPRRRRPTRTGARARWLGHVATLAATAGAALRHVWRRRRLRIALLVALVLAPALAGGWIWLRHSPLVSVDSVGVSGARGPQAHEIDAALVGAARHMSTLDVHTAALRAAVARFPIVSDVRASASFPHGLRIDVIEQPPVAALEVGGTRTAVAADGVVLGPALLSGSLPVLGALSLPAGARHVRGAALLGALSALGAAPARLAALVTRGFNGPKGLEFVLRHGPTAYFGSAERPHAKWLALALVLASERSAGAAYIDVRVPERPAAGFAPGTAPPAPASSSSGEGAPGGERISGGSESTEAALAAGLHGSAGESAAAAATSPRAGAGGHEGASESAGERSRGEASRGEAGGERSGGEGTAASGESGGH